ncbi:hypothetical protein C8R44DRAFT_975102 [Mycena epipterygia]|nr:hypothetical protein C8R44DRAFT_975102 [Mycena epipterygia]
MIPQELIEAIAAEVLTRNRHAEIAYDFLKLQVDSHCLFAFVSLMAPTASNPLRISTISPPSPPSAASHLRMLLAELDEEMDALESKLRLLAAKRHRVLQDLSSITYPVLTLLPEITAQIFSHYVHKPHIGRTRTPGRGPLLLTSVCRDWRDICLSIGSLWASLQVYPERYSSGDAKDLLSLLRCWLSRAGSQPLDLHVFRSSSGSISSKIFTLLSDYSSQWRSLGVTLQRPFSFPNDKIQARIPSLEQLVVNISAERRDVPVKITAFSVAPRLYDVRLYGASLQWISLPWLQLTHLEFSNDSESLSACVAILKQTQKLEVLIVQRSPLIRESPPIITTSESYPPSHPQIRLRSRRRAPLSPHSTSAQNPRTGIPSA